MAYPVQASATGTLTVPFRPAAAGLVNVIVSAVGIPPDPGDGSNGGSGGGVTPQKPSDPTPVKPNGGPTPTGQQTQPFHPFTVAVQLDIFKPGTSAPAASGLQHIDVALSTNRNLLAFAVSAIATDTDLSADWRVQVTSAPAGFSAKYPKVPARLNVTARYQVTPGNLGKIDHIVVLMMENRSFDHMLGSLSIPVANGGAGRSDVDGLKGGEYNLDAAGAPRYIHLRQAPKPGQSDTAFLTDPGHGWSDVVQQLGGDSRDPALTSNAGFVMNFAQQINNDVKNLPPGTQTVQDTAQIGGGDSHAIPFRPVLAGRITVEATPTKPPSHSESGLLGSVALRKPGSTAVLVNVKTPIGQQRLGLSYQATDAELATPGNWICTVTNGTEASLSFSTNVIYVAAPHDISNQELPDAVMSYYNAAQLPLYYFLAEHFAICDRWYASLPTDTWPNRLYAMTGGSGGLTQTPSDASVEQGPPGYLLRTIFENLQDRQIDWNIFFSDLPFALIFTRLAQDAAYTARMRSVDELVKRAVTGDLPSFCWVDPNFQDVPDDPNTASDDHPPGDVCRGQRFIDQVYTALSTSPAWAKTLLIITYDEHGGFYDHVLPPRAATIAVGPADPGVAPSPPPPVKPAQESPTVEHPIVLTTGEPPSAVAAEATITNPFGGPADDNPQLRAYGLRVPTFVVSPWVVPRSVSHQVYDHTSLLSTILQRFCRAPDGTVPSMGARTDHALDLDAMLSATPPALDAPKAPAPTFNCQGVQGPVVDHNTFGAVLRKSLFRF